MGCLQKNLIELAAYLISVVLVLAIVWQGGRKYAEWLLMKLYEWYIQRDPLNL